MRDDVRGVHDKIAARVGSSDPGELYECDEWNKLEYNCARHGRAGTGPFEEYRFVNNERSYLKGFIQLVIGGLPAQVNPPFHKAYQSS
ncbi:predicted protein [Pyrenophora tritici-repentis Pt-1C-BFP]|uniref:Uncharacterized protein n=1 Tax=Pyrenophora tritici-repentis (strain Pt-1C-BFP) TaxID=426418 RepID=B2WC50_PYRTR|nr:uncharacterized protein PTRG_07559 [Pyrenophora tritici-repentis Pt-1C-BFP]EDU50478.1 predicted protein [Pyrenophora tritici-repentis Pt-1C-BFP]